MSKHSTSPTATKADSVKVLFIDVRDSIGGDSTVLLNILRRIDTNRFTPFVACLNRGALFAELKTAPGLILTPLDFGTRDADVARHGLKGRLASAVSAFFTLAATLRLAWLVWRNKISVMHTNNTVRAVLVANLVSRLTGRPYIYHAHSALQDHPVQRRGAREAHCLLAVSRFTAATYWKIGAKPEQSIILHNGIDTVGLSPAYRSSVFRDELKIDPNVRLVGLVGRLTPSKGQEDLIEAAPEILRHAPDARFLLVGDDSIFDNNLGFADRLKARISELGVSDKFIFTGFRRDLRDIYSSLDIVLVPSRDPEGCNMVTLEAMAMGCPVVTSDAGGMPEIIESGAGLMVPAGDSAALGAAIIRVLTDKALAQSLAEAGRRRVEQSFNLEKYIGAFQGVVQQISLGNTEAVPVLEPSPTALPGYEPK